MFETIFYYLLKEKTIIHEEINQYTYKDKIYCCISKLFNVVSKKSILQTKYKYFG